MSKYIGRFAPSPSGPLHMGSLVTALASWVDARHHHGSWLLRVEDIDPPREVSGASDAIIESLRQHGLHWDDDVSYQRNHAQRYDNALQQLRQAGRLYACQCTRKQLRSESAAATSTAYPGHCRELGLRDEQRPLRVLVHDEITTFEDLHTGPQAENVSESVGDFIVRRKDTLYAYQLAVVVDDAHQQVTHVVRGADLLDNTARQIALQQALSYRQPAYLHLPLVTTDSGTKLSKQTGAPALDNSSAIDNLRCAWAFLGQPAVTATRHVQDFLLAATSQWQRSLIPKFDTPMSHF